MAKGSRRLVLGFLFIPLLYAAILRLNLSPLHLWKQQLSQWSSLSLSLSDAESQQPTGSTRLLLQRLVRGIARRELNHNGATCISEQHSDLCVTTNSVRLSVTAAGPTLYLTAGQNLPPAASNSFTLRPYPRRTDPVAMARTSAVTVLTNHNRPPMCNIRHTAPAIIFSAGGFAGNFFHDMNDVLIPLFLTSSNLSPNVHLVVTDLESYWAEKYRRVLRRLSAFDVISAELSEVVHCFPAAIVGLKYHGNLLCNETEAPGRVSTVDFRRFLHRSMSLRHLHAAADAEQPRLVLISRRKSRMLLNEDDVVSMAREAGFNVVAATTEMMARVEGFAELVNGCELLLGVHGAGLTNMVFLPPGAMLLQIVPWGLDWASTAYYARPARRLELHYLEYHIAVEESTLYEEYPKDHPVLADPWSINLRGYNVSRPVYTDGQNLRIDLPRLRETLLKAKLLLRPNSYI